LKKTIICVIFPHKHSLITYTIGGSEGVKGGLSSSLAPLGLAFGRIQAGNHSQ